MSEARFDVVGIGNAIVDVSAHTMESFIFENNLVKGSMSLIDEFSADELYKKMVSSKECSGGSSANTIATLASLGSKCAFIGKVKNDQLGKAFYDDITSLGVTYQTKADDKGPSTARCIIHVTPDAERTMQTFLGASINLGPDDIDETIISASKISYLEGYLWDTEKAKEAMLKAAVCSQNAGKMASLSLSDSFCVERHRDEFLWLIKNHINVLFANEEEIKCLYQASNFQDALKAVSSDCEIAILTRGKKGSVVTRGDEVYISAAETVDQVIDTTGAGDAYAAGFLYGLTADEPLPICARYGGICSAEAIRHVGARPEGYLKEFLKEKINATS